MTTKMRNSKNAKFVSYVFMFVFLGYFLLPLAWLLIGSTKTNAGLFSSFGFWFDKDFNLFQNVQAVFSYGNGAFAIWMRNTAVYATLAAVGSSLISSLAGYAFAQYRFVGRNLLFGIVLASVFVPTHGICRPALFAHFQKRPGRLLVGGDLAFPGQPVWRLLDAHLRRASHPTGFDRRRPRGWSRRVPHFCHNCAASPCAGLRDRIAVCLCGRLEQLLPALACFE